MAIPKRTNIQPQVNVDATYKAMFAAAIAGKVAAGTITNGASVTSGVLDDCAAIADAATEGLRERYTSALP